MKWMQTVGPSAWSIGVVFLGIAAAGCNYCTDAACANGVEVTGEWPPQGDLEVEVCLAESCNAVLMPVDGGVEPIPILEGWEVARSDRSDDTYIRVASVTGSSIHSPYPAEGSHLSVRVVGVTVLGELEVDISYEKFYPNGKGCLPVCDRAHYEL